MDRLSKLPDVLIQLILSKLEMRDVVRTTILSKSWRNLWRTVPCLSFEIKGLEAADVVKVRNFFYSVLVLWNGTRIKTFKIRVESFFVGLPSLFDDMRFWLSSAIDKKVEELHIILRHLRPGLYFSPPHSLYSCSSITSLRLHGCSCRQTCSDARWDQLRVLHIDGCQIDEDMIDRVVSGSPKLETIKLFFSVRPQDMTIKSSSLRIAEIGSAKSESSDTRLTISAPKLEALVIHGSDYKKCLVTAPSSLAKLELFLKSEHAPLLRETLRQIFGAIQHVKVLKLSCYCFEVLMLFDASFFSFPNVKLLEYYCYPIRLENIAGLVEAFRTVERLIIHLHPANDVILQDEREQQITTPRDLNNLESFLPHLRTVDIVWHDIILYWDDEIFGFLKFFLKHATGLSKLVIQDMGDRNYEEEAAGFVRKRPVGYMKEFLVRRLWKPKRLGIRKYEKTRLPLVMKRLASLQFSFPKVELVLVQKKSRCAYNVLPT